jgi:hypothetical protein
MCDFLNMPSDSWKYMTSAWSKARLSRRSARVTTNLTKLDKAYAVTYNISVKTP